MKLTLGPKVTRMPGSAIWSRQVEIMGWRYTVGIVRGSQPIRIAYKPAGQNIGWHWFGYVRDANGREVWSGQVNKSTGARGMLRWAGLIPKRAAAQKGGG